MGAACEHPTDVEVRLAERYVRVLDLVSRCAQAVDGGDWFYLQDKARQLWDAAEGLRRVADGICAQVRAGSPRPRTEVVRALVARWGSGYRAGRLLHPEPEQGQPPRSGVRGE